MCGRIIQSSGAPRYAIVEGMNVRDSRVHNCPPRWNAAPSQELLVIRRNHHKRRCIVPVDGFFEWKAIKGQKAKQPYAIAMKDGVRQWWHMDAFKRVFEIGRKDAHRIKRQHDTGEMTQTSRHHQRYAAGNFARPSC